MKLTIKQKAFADYYIELGNATEAAIKAGYNPKTARQIGSMNLTKVDIKSYIDERMKGIESDRIAKAEEVLAFLSASYISSKDASFLPILIFSSIVPLKT